MKLVHPQLEQQIIFGDNNSCEWVIESPELLFQYIQKLYMQINGTEGGFVLSEGMEEVELSKYAEIVIDPFMINLNDRKVMTKLYMELSQIAGDGENYLMTQEIMGSLQKYLFLLEQQSPYILETNPNIDIMAIFKALGVKIQDYSENHIEKTNQYIKIMAGLLRKRLIIFVNIGCYFTNEQIVELIKTAKCEEISLLFIENIQRNFPKEVLHYIIDEDKCEI
ncbi:MAG: type II-A CRISPR-associated protein Csn2 [Clostridia bacterium]|nr:type II-A CRISPR-associated protein Csn2 [Clostridia bacterium]NCD03760.1 type II-A CRISPR-associated protein Csn2 [Clostridia bacterium]